MGQQENQLLAKALRRRVPRTEEDISEKNTEGEIFSLKAFVFEKFLRRGRYARGLQGEWSLGGLATSFWVSFTKGSEKILEGGHQEGIQLTRGDGESLSRIAHWSKLHRKELWRTLPAGNQKGRLRKATKGRKEKI